MTDNENKEQTSADLSLQERLAAEEAALQDMDQPDDLGPGLAAPGGATGAQLAGAVGVAHTTQASLWGDAWRQLRKSPLFIIPVLFLSIFTVMAFAPGLFTDTDPKACNIRNNIVDGELLIRGPGEGHPFGYDVQGCDYYSRVIYGARVSLSIGLLTVFLSSLIAVVLGSISGFYGRWVDGVVTRFADIIFALPLILGGIILLNSLGSRTVLTVSFALLLFIWPSPMRLMRSSVLSIKEMDYVQAARAMGAKDFRIMRKHILPNGLAPVIVYATITVGITITVEATLTFLGVGLQLPAISWGLMISGAQFRILEYPHLLFFPAIFLVVMVFSFILLGDALRDALDPRSR